MKLRPEDGLTRNIPESSGIYAAVSPDDEVLYIGMASKVAQTITQHEKSPWLRIIPHVWMAKEMFYSELAAERHSLLAAYKPRGNTRLGRPALKRHPRWIQRILKEK